MMRLSFYTLIYFFSLLYCMNIVPLAAQPIPNGSFEEWTEVMIDSVHSLEMPLPWGTSYSFYQDSLYTDFRKTDDAFRGEYALQLSSAIPGPEGLQTSVSSIFVDSSDLLQKPIALNAWVKCNRMVDNVFLGRCEVKINYCDYKSDGRCHTQLDFSFWEATTNIDKYQLIHIPLLDTHYDTLWIRLIGGSYAGPLDSRGNSIFTIDALSFDYAPVSIQEQLEQSVHIYPNPFENQISKDFLLNLLVSEAIDSNDITTATNLLLEDSTLQADKKLLGLKFKTADFAGAQALVNSFPSVTQDEIWYRDIQNINIIRLQQDTFVLDSLQEAVLYEIAQSDSYNRAYARSLLALLKGERIEDDDSSGVGGGQNAIQQSEGSLPLIEHKVNIMPNPAKDEIYIVWQENPAEDQQLCIFDRNGKIMQSLRLPAGTSQLRLNIADLPNGLYYLHIGGDSRSRLIRKFVVFK